MENVEIKRVGFLIGQITVPEDFDRMGAEIIQALFDGSKLPPNTPGQ